MCWILFFIHTSRLRMIAKKFWPPVYESKTEYGWKVKFIPDTEWQDTSRHRDPGRGNLPIYLTQSGFEHQWR